MNRLQCWFHRRTRKFESTLFGAAAALLALLLISQLLMLNAKFRIYLSRVESLEGIRYEGAGDISLPGE